MKVLWGWVLFLVGGWLAFQAAQQLAWAVEGFDPGAPASSECDDCGLTVLLDAWWVVVLVLGAYLVLAVLLLRRFWSGPSDSSAVAE